MEKILRESKSDTDGETCEKPRLQLRELMQKHTPIWACILVGCTFFAERFFQTCANK